MKKNQARTGVYIGDVLVTPKEGYIKIFAMNSAPENMEFTLPPIELEKIDIIDHKKLTLNKIDSYSEKKQLMQKECSKL